jgi:tetrahydromethanopterin S-methyltransferase subunit F
MIAASPIPSTTRENTSIRAIVESLEYRADLSTGSRRLRAEKRVTQS